MQMFILTLLLAALAVDNTETEKNTLDQGYKMDFPEHFNSIENIESILPSDNLNMRIEKTSERHYNLQLKNSRQLHSLS